MFKDKIDPYNCLSKDTLASLLINKTDEVYKQYLMFMTISAM